MSYCDKAVFIFTVGLIKVFDSEIITKHPFGSLKADIVFQSIRFFLFFIPFKL